MRTGEHIQNSRTYLVFCPYLFFFWQFNTLGFYNTDLWLLGRFNHSVAGILIAIVFAFFFLAFFVLYITRRADDPAGVRTARGCFRSRLAAAGLDPSVIAALPTFEYAAVKDLKIGKGALECAVCITEFGDDKETLRLLPGCDHVFHADCIDEWLCFHSTCPVCRADLTHTQSESTPAAEKAEDRDSIVVIVPTRTRSTSRTRFVGKFLRSHWRGHSPVQPAGESGERFTLRLPEHSRKELLKRK